jgi:hypothetical protein
MEQFDDAIDVHR